MTNSLDQFVELPVCPLCRLRAVFSWKTATECCVPLSLIQDGFCSACDAWLTEQEGALATGALIFQKPSQK
jgi:hypothetical protein